MKKVSNELQGVIAQMLKPLKGLSLGIVIEGLSNYEVIQFDKKNTKDLKVLKILIKVANNVLFEVNQNGIKRSRPNEVGNDIEPFVIQELEKLGYKALIPKTFEGKSKTTGYPDIEFIDEFDRVNYLECKTFNVKNIATTQRSFYLSPSKEFKVTQNAIHFGISFEVFVDKNIGNNRIYKVNSWKILDLSKLELDVKYEFNSDNKRLYNENLILAEK